MRKKKYLLALDLALGNSGYAIFEIDTEISDAPIIKIGSINTGKGKSRSSKLNLFGNTIIKILGEYNIIEVAFESGFVRFHEATKAIFQITGVAMYLLHPIPQYFYPPATVKKGVGGSGNSSKDDVAVAIKKIYPHILFENTDESDAVSVGIHHLRITKGVSDGT